jgi:hypothetical protein
MDRFVSAANRNEAAKAAISLVVMVDLDFASGMIRAHDGGGTLTWDGNDYLGVGQFGAVADVTEDLTNIARPVRLTLSGVDPSLVSTTMTETYQNRSVTLYLAFIESESNTIIAAPEIVWEGRMDTMKLSVSQGSAVIELNCEHRLRREPRISRYTNEEQQVAHPGDRFFDLLTTIKDYPGRWGDKAVFYQAAAQLIRSFLNK